MLDKIVAGSSELGPRKNGHGRNVMSKVEKTGSDDGAGCDGGRYDRVAATLRARTPAPRHGNA